MEQPIVQVNTPPSHNSAKQSRHRLWFALVLLIIFTASSFGAYYWQKNKVKNSTNNVNSLNSQITKLKTQVDTITAINNGTVPPQAQKTTPTNELSLASDNVVLTLPSGWVKATASSLNSICTGGSIASKALCEDIATVVPSGLNKNDPNNAFSVNVSVFQYSDNKSAKNWLNIDYGAGFTNTTEPQAIDQSTQPINGYDAFTYTKKYSDTDYPTYIYYDIVHGKYAVVISSAIKTTVNPSGTQGGSINKDYSSYLSDIKSLVNSIKISD